MACSQWVFRGFFANELLWLTRLAGIHGSLREEGFSIHNPVARIIETYHLGLEESPTSSIQLTNEDIRELDATFITSGPFRLRRTLRLMDHLQFDDNYIQVYFDGELQPGYSGVIFMKNLIAKSASSHISRANS